MMVTIFRQEAERTWLVGLGILRRYRRLGFGLDEVGVDFWTEGGAERTVGRESRVPLGRWRC